MRGSLRSFRRVRRVRRWAPGIALLVAACAFSPSQDFPTGTPHATLDLGSPYKTTLEDFMLQTKAFLEDQGYEVTLDPDNYWSLVFTFGDPQQQQDVQGAVHDCEKNIDPARLEAVPERTTEQLRALYAYVGAEAACLTDLGYELPSPRLSRYSSIPKAIGTRSARSSWLGAH